MTETISWLEVAWMTILAVGTVASTWMVYQSIADLRARTKLKRNGLMLRRIRNDIRTEVIRLLILISLNYFTYFAVTTPTRADAVWDIRTILGAAVLMFIPLALSYDAVRSAMTRHYIIEKFDEENNQNHTT